MPDILREPSWVDVIGSGPFNLTRETDPRETILRVDTRVYGAAYRVGHYSDTADVNRQVVDELTYQAKQRIIEDYGLAGHIEKQLAEDQVDSLGRLRSLIFQPDTTKFDILAWIDDERKRVRENRR